MFYVLLFSMDLLCLIQINVCMYVCNKGDFAHNSEVLKAGEGVIIPYRRPYEDVPYTRYLPCNFCFGFLKKDGLWQHMKVCPLKVDSGTCGQKRVQARSALLLPLREGASQQMRENVLETMQHDAASIAVKNDPLILDYGSRLYDAMGHEKHTHNYVSQKMRELGRLLLQARQQSELITSFSTLIDPVKFKYVVSAVRTICGFNDKSHDFAVPSLSLKLGHAVKRCAEIMKSDGLQNGDSVALQQAKDFIERLKMQETAMLMVVHRCH